MKNRKGFTLVELIIAGLLAGVALLVALPLLLTGQNADIREEKREAVSMAGDAIYQYVAEEMQFAGRVFIGDGSGKTPPSEEQWKAVSVSKAEDGGHKKLQFREKKQVSDLDLGGTLYEDAYQQNLDLVIEAEAVERSRLALKVCLLDGDEAVYEKEGTLALLNLTLYGTGQLEGYVGGRKTTNPAEGSGETPLVLWYQSTRQSVNPFQGESMGTGDPVPPSGTPGEAMVLLADTQYVKVGETLSVQFKAQGATENPIAPGGYSWSIKEESNRGPDGFYVDPDLVWNENNGALIISGLSATPEGAAVELSLTITLADGTTLTDSGRIVVYENDRPGHEPVDGFVIVPDGMEEEYAFDVSRPIWVRKDTSKKVVLVAVKDGGIVEYSPEEWYCTWNDKTPYKGFGFDWNRQESYLWGDGDPNLESGTKTETDENGIGRNYVILTSNGMCEDIYNPEKNNRGLCFGLPFGATGYRPNGTTPVLCKREVNLYDAEGMWTSCTDSGNGILEPVTTVVEDMPTVYTGPSDAWVDLGIELDLYLNLPQEKQIKKPEIDPGSVIWYVDGEKVFEGNDICRFGIKDGGGYAGILPEGTNTVSVHFKDTAGYSYTSEIQVVVPSEVSYVEFDEKEVYLVNLGGKIAIEGVTARTLHYNLYDKDGNRLPGDNTKNSYWFEWTEETGEENGSPVFSVNKSNFEASVTAQNSGEGTVTLVLKDKKTKKEIMGADGKPCTCKIVVQPLELELWLRYIDGNGAEKEAAIQSGKAIPVFRENVNQLIGFNAVLSLPDKVAENMTEERWKLLEKTEWSKAQWSHAPTTLFWGNQEWNSNRYTVGYNQNGTGTTVFTAKSVCDPEVSGEVSVIMNQSPVEKIQVSNVDANGGKELVVGGKAAKERYNQIQLKAEVTSSGGDCDQNVIWTIPQGRNLVDTESLTLNLETDSRTYMPVIRLKDGLTNEAVKEKKIVVRASSASSGERALYEIDVLPQFQIVVPYADRITMTHMADKKGNQSPDSAGMEASREADWTISPEAGYLKIAGAEANTKTISVTTQNMTKGTAEYQVKAVDVLTGQTDVRTVEVRFEELVVESEKDDAWIFQFEPSGLLLMDVGEKTSVTVTNGGSRLVYMKEAPLLSPAQSESIGVKVTDIKKSLGLIYSEKLEITALKPGTTTVRVEERFFGVDSSGYVKILVRGLQLPDSLSLDRNQTANLSARLESGDISEFQWTSSAPNIASVDGETGLVTAVNPGKAIITVSGRANSTGKRYTSRCEVTVTASGWGTIDSVTNRWSGSGTTAIHLLAGSPLYGAADMKPSVTGSGSTKYPLFYLVESLTAGVPEEDILTVEGNTASAKGTGTVSIVAGAGDKTSAPLTAVVHELHGISVQSKDGNNMLNFITGTGEQRLTLSAQLVWGEGGETGVPNAWKGVVWSVDKTSDGYVDIVSNADGTCTVTATGMGAAYITCTSAANPEVSETFVVIVSF